MNEKRITRILLADDHDVVRRGLRVLLETQPGWEVCGEAADGRRAVELAITLKPDVVVMDLNMPLLNGFDATHRILRRLPRTQILVLTMHESEQLIRELLAAGVRGYLLKSDAGQHLISAIESFIRGKTVFTSPVASRIHTTEFQGRIRGRRTGPKGPLTMREREILQLLAEGMTNRDAAQVLNISVKTAETHRARIMTKLEANSLADVIRYAIRNGLIQP